MAPFVTDTDTWGTTQRAAATGDTMALIEQVRAFCAQHGDRMTAVFSAAAPEPFVLALLESPCIKSVILAAPLATAPDIDPERVGWLRADGRVARAPVLVGDLVLVFGDPEAFGYELAKVCLRRSGKRIAFDTPFGFTTPISLWRLLFGRIYRGVGRALRRKVRDVVLSGRFGRLDPILGRLYRRLLRPLLISSREKQRLARLIKQIQQRPAHDGSVPGRLVFVTGSLGPGGAERQLVNTIGGLAARGADDLHLLADRLSPAPHDFYRPTLESLDGLSVLELGSVSIHDPTERLAMERLTKDAPPEFRTEIMKLTFLFRRLRPEVVHAWQDGCSAKAGIAAVLAGVDRVVLSWRSLSPLVTGLYNPCYEPVFQTLASRDNVVMLNNSAAGAASYADWLGLASGRIQIIRNGADFSCLQPPNGDAMRAYRESLGLPADALVVGTLFRFGPEKRPMLWLETAAKVLERRPDVHFLMIGDGPLREQVQATAAAWGLDAHVHLPGRTTTPALSLAAMDLFLLTSAFEGLPNVIVEAGAMGVPVVTTDVGGMRETFLHGETGFAVASHEPAALADRIIELLADHDWRRQARHLAPIWVRERFAMDRMVDATLEAYSMRSGHTPETAQEERSVA
ncbi:MAG: glycosyltransferase [Geminicoccaceae bacterium]